MPYISVSVSAKPDSKLASAIATRIGALTNSVLGKAPELIAVTTSFIDPDHWFVGGRALSEQKLASFWLDIKITQDTNSKQEMANYSAAVFQEFEKLLGPLHTESYILVQAVPAHAYGYGGLTQEYRYIASKVA